MATLEEWIAREALAFSLDAAGVHAAVDRIVAALGPRVTLLGLGEPTHGAEAFLILRNRMFERLAEAHGYTAIALESSFTRGPVVDQFVLGEIQGTYDDVQERGFSHNFGRSAANREMVEWMRQYNAAKGTRLRFYGFDSPTEMTHADSPRRLLAVALDFLAANGDAGVAERRARIETLLGEDAAWEDPSSTFDASKSIGLSAAATALRIETENLILHLRVNRPRFGEGYREALHHAEGARSMLDYHAQVAGTAETRYADLLGIRDLIMADNLGYIAARERERGGKVFVFAHNSHLQRGRATWQWGPNHLQWWPAGSHVDRALGDAFAVVGTGAVELASHGVGLPEAGTLEALLAAEASGTAGFVPTHRGRELGQGSREMLRTRTDSVKNPGYFPFTAQSLADFDGLIALR